MWERSGVGDVRARMQRLEEQVSPRIQKLEQNVAFVSPRMEKLEQQVSQLDRTRSGWLTQPMLVGCVSAAVVLLVVWGPNPMVFLN